jgi:hypothetical protein
MAHLVTFKNIHPTETLVIEVTGGPNVSMAPNDTDAFDLDLNDPLTEGSLRHFLHAGALVVYTTP